MKRALSTLAAALLSTLAGGALAESAAPEGAAAPAREAPAPPAQQAAGAVVVVVTPAAPPPEAPPPEHPRSRPEIALGAGLRGSLLPSAGLDPYSQSDFLLQGSFLGSLTVVRSGPAAILLFAEWDLGTRSGAARGQESSLTVHRLLGGAETRLFLGRYFYFDAKVAPVAYHLRGTIADASLTRPLVSRTWTWGLDVTGGAGVVLAGARSPRGPKLYLTLDLGYTFAGEAGMSYAPREDPEDPRKYGAVRLPSFKPSGATSRLGLALGF